MKRVLFLTLLLTAALSVQAQDIITLLDNGKEIKANVISINDDVVKYKAWENIGATKELKVLRTDVFKIKYQDGRIEVLNKPTGGKVIETSDDSFVDEISTIAKEKPPVVVYKPPVTDDKQPVVAENRLDVPKKTIFTEPKPSIPEDVNADKLIENRLIRPFTFGFWLGGSYPLDVYGAQSLNDYDNAGGAKMGVTGGVNAGYRVNKNIAFLLESQFTLHPYSVKISDAQNIYTLSGNWLHTNVFPTVRFDFPLVSNNRRYLSLFATGGAGLGISVITGDFADVLYELGTATVSPHLAYGGSAGVQFKDINLAVRYAGGLPSFESIYKPIVHQIQATLGLQF